MNTKTISIQEQNTGELIPEDSIQKIVRAIANKFSPEKIVLFGSYANKHQTADSDLDLLIIMETDLPRYKRAVPIKMLFKPMPCAMDIFVYTPEEAAYWDGTINHIITEALLTGKTVYERKKH